MDKDYKVSVVCITYNQADYITKAIDSFLAQKTDFDFEIIIHDDVSTDGTIEILKKYEKKYASNIKVIYEKENQWSKGVDVVIDIINKVAKGKYIAFCEGDDFWVDINKLQIQYDEMEKHPECDMCACWGCTINEDGSKEISQIRPIQSDGILSVENVILGGGQYIVSAGLFYRKDLFFYQNIKPFEKVIVLDYAVQIKGALRGGIYYIDRKMAAYRRYSKGSWTNDVLCNNDNLKKQWEKEKQLLEALDIDTNKNYHEVILRRLKDYTSFESQLRQHKDEIISELADIKAGCFIWGMGRRGKSLDVYLNEIGVRVDGICDAMETDIGCTTQGGVPIVSTSFVMEHATTIIASTILAYDDLVKSDFDGKILNYQKYMPLG